MKKDTLVYNNKKARWEYEDASEARRRRYMLLKLMQEKDAELAKLEAESKAAGHCPKCGMRRPSATFVGRCQNIYCSHKFN